MEYTSEVRRVDVSCSVSSSSRLRLMVHNNVGAMTKSFGGKSYRQQERDKRRAKLHKINKEYGKVDRAARKEVLSDAVSQMTGLAAIVSSTANPTAKPYESNYGGEGTGGRAPDATVVPQETQQPSPVVEIVPWYVKLWETIAFWKR